MLNRKLGPVMLDVAGIELQAHEKEILAHPQVGGLILFSRNFESSDQLSALVRCVREVRPSLVVSVDHEGGRVQRFREGFTKLPPMQSLINTHGEATPDALNDAKEIAWLMASELIAHDIDISFAPVLDLDDCVSDIIGDRSFSPDASIATSLAEAFLDGMHDAGMATTGKHFPGHGGVKADSHLELPIDSRSMAELKAHDLVPFIQLKDKLDGLMSAHIAFPNIDEALVSFSPFWLKDFLRTELAYQGLVFSDDLSMEGAAGAGSYSDRAYQALTAGCDVVLVCNKPDKAIEVIETLEGSEPIPTVCGLEKMVKSEACTLEALKRSDRWQRATNIVERLRG